MIDDGGVEEGIDFVRRNRTILRQYVNGLWMMSEIRTLCNEGHLTRRPEATISMSASKATLYGYAVSLEKGDGMKRLISPTNVVMLYPAFCSLSTVTMSYAEGSKGVAKWVKLRRLSVSRRKLRAGSRVSPMFWFKTFVSNETEESDVIYEIHTPICMIADMPCNVTTRAHR